MRVPLAAQAWRLSQVVPNIISVEFNPGASRHILNATVADLMEQMRKATPAKIIVSKEKWLEERGAASSVGADHQQPHGETKDNIDDAPPQARAKTTPNPGGTHWNAPKMPAQQQNISNIY